MERAPGGDPVYRHERRERDIEAAIGDETLIASFEAHFQRFFPDAEPWVLHEIISTVVHIDVHVIPPGPARNWITLVTTGMASRPMPVPEGLEEFRLAELALALPPDWVLPDTAEGQEPRHYWPVELLKFIARMPQEFDTFLWFGHTIAHWDPPEPYAESTELCGAMLGPLKLAPPGFDKVPLPDGSAVHVWGVYPVYGDELDFKLKRGTDALGERLDDAGVTELVDPARASVARRRGLFGKR